MDAPPPEGPPKKVATIVQVVGTILVLVVLGLAVGGAVLGVVTWHEEFWSAVIQRFQ